MGIGENVPTVTGGVGLQNWPAVRRMRRTYDEDTLNAANKFEEAYQVDGTIREQLRQLEATGQYRWMRVEGTAGTNYDPAWVFAPSADGVNPNGPVLALSQPEYGNYVYVPYAIADALELAYEQWGADMPRSFRPEDEGPAAPATIDNPAGEKTPPKKGRQRPPMRGKSIDLDMEVKGVTRNVVDSAYWGLPVGTPIKPGMKPQGTGKGKSSSVGTTASSSRMADTASETGKVTPSGHPTPKKRVVLKLSGGPKVDKPSGINTDNDTEDKPKPDTKPDETSKPEASGGPIDTSPRMAADFSVESAAEELKKIKVDGRAGGAGTLEDPVDVGDDLELAHRLLSEGKHIRMDTPMGVSSLIDKIREVGADAKAKGDKAPEYDLCKVSVPKTNLFCAESKGIPRVKMPQFKGEAIDGTFASTRRNAKGEGDVEPEWSQLLEQMGIEVTPKIVKASELKASQDNLDGVKVAGMAKAMEEGKIPDAPIFVTRDGYILDGHHRWAAKVVTALNTDDVDMPVMMIDCEIGYAIDLANGFTAMAGIKQKGMGAAADGVKGVSISEVKAFMRRMNGEEPCIPCGDKPL